VGGWPRSSSGCAYVKTDRRTFLIAGALIVPCLMAGCKPANKSHNVANTVASTPAGAAVLRATPTPSPQALLDDAIRNTEALKSFHFTLTHENGTTPIAQGIAMRKADGDFVKPDRFRANVSGTVLQGFAVDVKVINVGDRVWLATSGNKYSPLENGIAAKDILDPNNGVVKALKGVRSPVAAGVDKINGVDTTIVTGSIDAGDLLALDAQAQAGKPVNGRMWVGVADHRLYRLRLEGPLNDQEPANIARQIDLSSFDENLDIQPPA